MSGVVDTGKFLISGAPKPKLPTLPDLGEVPNANDANAEAAAEEAKRKNANRKGRSSTILTGLVPDDNVTGTGKAVLGA